jgi:hypothetical protein
MTFMNDVELQSGICKLVADCGLPTEQALLALFVAAEQIAFVHCMRANNGRLNSTFITVDDVLATAKQGAAEISKAQANATFANTNTRVFIATQPRN